MTHTQIDQLLKERTGHFEFESGHHGDTWLELETLFHQPALLQPLVESLSTQLRPHVPEVVCGPLTEGAFLALQVSLALDLPFCYADRSLADGRASYRIPGPLGRQIRDKRVALVDDVFNAGSAVRGTLAALREAGAVPVVIGALVLYGSSAADIASANEVALESLDQRPCRIWTPADCPLCAQRVPLESPV